MGNGVPQKGQTFDSKTGVIAPFTETMMDWPSTTAVLGQAATEIIPKDAQNALVRVHDSISAALLAIAPRKVDGTIHMSKGQLPDTLVSIAVSYNENELSGEHIQDPANAISVGTSVSLSLTASASAQAGAATTPAIQPIIRETPGDAVPCTHAFFYMTGNVTRAAALTRLAAADAFNAAVLSWPMFKPIGVTINLHGQNVSVRAEANSAVSIAQNVTSGDRNKSILPGNDPGNVMGNGAVTGLRSDGFSKELGTTSQIVTISPTIHAPITLSSTGHTKAAQVQVKADIAKIGPGAGYTPAVTNEPAIISEDATSLIDPGSVAATSPAVIPTSGLYLVELSTDFYDSENSFVHAVVINASVFA